MSDLHPTTNCEVVAFRQLETSARDSSEVDFAKLQQKRSNGLRWQRRRVWT